MLGIIIATIWFIVIMYLDVQSDYKRIQTNSVVHSRGLLIRAAALIPSFLCFLLPVSNPHITYIVIKAVVVAGMMASWWWEFFDGWLNTKRGYSWRFNGSEDSDDAVADNFLQNFSPAEQLWLKWTLIVIFTLTYLFL